MNDLMSKSFAAGKGLGYSDIEMGAAPTVNLDKFFEDVELVKEDLIELEKLRDELQQANNRSKTLHSAKAIHELRASMDANVSASLRKAKIIKVRLEALDRANASNRSIPGCGPGSSSDRTRTSVVNSLRKKLADSMDSFNELRSSISSEYRETVQRRIYTVTGETPDERTLDRLISTGESESILQKAIQEQGRGSIMDMVNEIQERHSAAKDLEKNLRDLHQVFLDMAVLVEEQGQQLDDIESNVQRAKSFVSSGADRLQSARVYQKNTRLWTVSAILILIIIIIVVVLLIVKPWQK